MGLIRLPFSLLLLLHLFLPTTPLRYSPRPPPSRRITSSNLEADDNSPFDGSDVASPYDGRFDAVTFDLFRSLAAHNSRSVKQQFWKRFGPTDDRGDGREPNATAGSSPLPPAPPSLLAGAAAAGSHPTGSPYSGGRARRAFVVASSFFLGQLPITRIFLRSLLRRGLAAATATSPGRRRRRRRRRSIRIFLLCDAGTAHALTTSTTTITTTAPPSGDGSDEKRHDGNAASAVDQVHILQAIDSKVLTLRVVPGVQSAADAAEVRLRMFEMVPELLATRPGEGEEAETETKRGAAVNATDVLYVDTDIVVQRPLDTLFDLLDDAIARERRQEEEEEEENQSVLFVADGDAIGPHGLLRSDHRPSFPWWEAPQTAKWFSVGLFDSETKRRFQAAARRRGSGPGGGGGGGGSGDNVAVLDAGGGRADRPFNSGALLIRACPEAARLLKEAFDLRRKAYSEAADQACLNHVLLSRRAVRVMPFETLQVMFATTPEETMARLPHLESIDNLFRKPLAHFCGFGLGGNGFHGGGGRVGEGGGRRGAAGRGGDLDAHAAHANKAALMREWERELEAFDELEGVM